MGAVTVVGVDFSLICREYHLGFTINPLDNSVPDVENEGVQLPPNDKTAYAS